MIIYIIFVYDFFILRIYSEVDVSSFFFSFIIKTWKSYSIPSLKIMYIFKHGL